MSDKPSECRVGSWKTLVGETFSLNCKASVDGFLRQMYDIVPTELQCGRQSTKVVQYLSLEEPIVVMYIRVQAVELYHSIYFHIKRILRNKIVWFHVNLSENFK